MGEKYLLAGRVALVTGGGGEIGTAVCHRFAQEGAAVVVGDISLEKAEKVADEINRNGGKSVAVRLDVSDPDSCSAAVDLAVKTFGKLTTLANVAAAATPLGDAEKLSLDDWNRAFQVNVTGQFLMSKFAVAAMRKAGGGAIVSIAAVLQLTKCLAIDFAKDNIRANTISPGAIDTERAALQRFKSREEANRAKGPAYLVGRTGKVEEIAAGATYLASDESSFMTGTDLLLDGGYMAFKGAGTPCALFRRRPICNSGFTRLSLMSR
jgi:NAD(P)-dependent dehydrogenase (short-subunit alcohol dehydrogenase family)